MKLPQQGSKLLLIEALVFVFVFSGAQKVELKNHHCSNDQCNFFGGEWLCLKAVLAATWKINLIHANHATAFKMFGCISAQQPFADNHLPFAYVITLMQTSVSSADVQKTAHFVSC